MAISTRTMTCRGCFTKKIYIVVCMAKVDDSLINAPIITVYATSCVHPTRCVPEYQSTFIGRLLCAGFYPLIDTQERVDRFALTREIGVVFYDTADGGAYEVVPCAHYDTSRRPLATVLYRTRLEPEELQTIALWLPYLIDLKETREEFVEKASQTFITDKLVLEERGCFSAAIPTVTPITQSEFIGNNVVCE